MECCIYLVDGTYAFKGFHLGNSGQFLEINQHFGHFEKVFPEDVDEFNVGYKRAEYGKCEKAFRAGAAPDVGFAAGITAFKSRVVFHLSGKQAGYLQFAERTQETEEVENGRNVGFKMCIRDRNAIPSKYLRFANYDLRCRICV